MPERRTYTRYEVTVAVVVNGESRAFDATSENISSGGMFLHTPEIVPLGTPLSLTFTLPGGATPITAAAHVAWIRDRDLARPSILCGIGVQFYQLADMDLELLEAFLGGL